MLYREDEKWICIIIIYIQEAIDAAIKVLQSHFQVKDPTSLEDYLGVRWWQEGWLGQSIIIKSSEKQFGESCKEENDYYTWNTRVYWWIGG